MFVRHFSEACPNTSLHQNKVWTETASKKAHSATAFSTAVSVHAFFNLGVYFRGFVANYIKIIAILFMENNL